MIKIKYVTHCFIDHNLNERPDLILGPYKLYEDAHRAGHDLDGRFTFEVFPIMKSMKDKKTKKKKKS